MNYYKGTYFIKNGARIDREWTNSDTILVNNQNSSQLKEAILQIIENSKKCLKICSFILNDMDVFLALKQKLVQEEVVLFLLTSLDPSKLSSNYLTEEEESKNNISTHQKFINTLYNLGGHVRAADNIHAKFIVSDSIEAIIMSANLTKYSLSLNPESGIFISDQNDIKSIEVLFEKIYLKATTFKSFRKRGNGKSIVESLKKSINPDDFKSLGGQCLTYTYENLNNSIYQNLISIINNSESYLLVGTYSIVELLNLPELIESLRKAKQRNVDIKFFCRSMNHRRDHLEGCEMILELGIPVYGDLYNHAKGIVNEKEGMIFTANIDGRHGLKSGFEVGLKLNEPHLSSLKEFLEWQIDSAYFVACQNPSKKELHLSEAYKENLKNLSNIETFKEIIIDTGPIKKQVNLLESPIYLLCEGEKVCGIKVNGKTYGCILSDEKITLTQEKKLFTQFQYMIKYENIKII